MDHFIDLLRDINSSVSHSTCFPLEYDPDLCYKYETSSRFVTAIDHKPQSFWRLGIVLGLEGVTLNHV